MTIIEFMAAIRPFPEAKHYFVGVDLAAILADTSGGTGFGGAEFVWYREISVEEARAIGVRGLQNGIRAILEQDCSSFKLDSPWAC